MKNIDNWKPTKFVFENGNFIANEAYVGSGSKYIADLVAFKYQAYLPLYAKGDLLDLGCGTVPFYELYSRYVHSVTCVDWDSCIHDMSFVDFSADLNQSLNIQEGSFDTVLLSDVLEHIYAPKQLLNEIYAILRKDGILILNVPFAYWEHEAPHDYYRYTRYFFEKTAREIGFDILVNEQIGSDAFDVFFDISSKLKKINNSSFASKLLLLVLRRFRGSIKHSALNLPLGYFVVMKKIDYVH